MPVGSFQSVESRIGGGARSGHWPGGRGLHAEVSEDFLGCLGLGDHGQQVAATVAALAMKDIEGENSAQKRRPVEAGM